MGNADMSGFDMQQKDPSGLAVDSPRAIGAIRAAQFRIAAERGWCEGEDLRNWDALNDVMVAIRERDVLIDELRMKAGAAAHLGAVVSVLLDAQMLLVNIESGAQLSLRESEIRREWVQQLADWPYLKNWFRRCGEAIARARGQHAAAARGTRAVDEQVIQTTGGVSA